MIGAMQWFGPQPFGPICETSEKRPVPIGHLCIWCDEPFVADDSGFLAVSIESEQVTRRPWHRECFMRTICGSIAHVEMRCSCFGGTDAETDTGGLTLSKREEARIAVSIWGGSGLPRRKS